ncbi:MAG TPA: SRPBCC family protein [Chloroflexota bacterium]|nr:SRPBCC family protein [Chloroflexota bacterium]
MMTNTTSDTTVTLPSDRELVITRTFDAPRALVFEAMTRPEHVRHWYGPRRFTLVLCEIDLRVGGAWRYVLRDPSGAEYGFSGVYREIVPPERLVSTEGFEGMPGHEYLATLTLDEHDGKTTLTNTLLYQSVEDRDGHLQSGMEPGMRETLDRLAELLATLA